MNVDVDEPEYKIALTRLRRWLREDMVKLGDGVFVRKTGNEKSRRLFVEAIIALGGEIISEDRQPFPNGPRIFYVLRATLPLTLEDIASPPRYRGGRHKKPYEAARQRLNVRLLGRTINQAKGHAERHGLANFWHSLDEAMNKLAGDEE